MRPFTVDVPDEVLDDLRERLARTRWPEQIPDAGWDYGTNVGYLRELCEYWRTGFDWRAAEARLNAFPQFLDTVDDLDLHFLRVPGTGPDPFPLLMLHGWPGSVWEYLDVIGPLTDPGAHGGDPADAFEVVVASLPGFGFSGKPRVRGWGPTRTAAAFDELMGRLGFSRYGTQGGDWGGILSAQIGADHPRRCAGIHVNHVHPPLADPPPGTEERVAEYLRFRAAESAYSDLQRTKPDSLTVGHNDSPAALAAWIVEKFRTWSDTDPPGDVESAFTRDDLLANITIYWVTGTAPSAARMYWERGRDAHAESRPPVWVPTAVAAFPKEPFMLPRALTERRYPVVRWTDMPSGGHFPALERPVELVEDVRAFYREIRAGG